jgi:hypothetical protein
MGLPRDMAVDGTHKPKEAISPFFVSHDHGWPSNTRVYCSSFYAVLHCLIFFWAIKN